MLILEKASHSRSNEIVEQMKLLPWGAGSLALELTAWITTPAGQASAYPRVTSVHLRLWLKGECGAWGHTIDVTFQCSVWKEEDVHVLYPEACQFVTMQSKWRHFFGVITVKDLEWRWLSCIIQVGQSNTWTLESKKGLFLGKDGCRRTWRWKKVREYRLCLLWRWRMVLPTKKNAGSL